MKTSEILAQARKRIEKPEHWIKGAVAIDGAGHRVDPLARDAVCFCAIGAIRSVINPLSEMPAYTALAKATNYASVAGFNDAPNTTHGDVLAMFDRAIAEAKQKEANLT